MRIRLFSAVAIASLLAPAAAWAAEVLIPRGTIVYGQLDERITSNPRKFRVGFEPYVSIWKDVEVNGVVVIEAGTSVAAQITQLSPRGIGGRGSEIEISALTVGTISGEEINLRGGYGQATPDRQGLNRALSMIFWPTSFLPGGRAELEEGMVFDMEVPNDTYIQVPDDLIPTLSLRQPSGLAVLILFEQFTSRSEELPIEIRLCEHDWTNDIVIDSVNDAPVRPIDVSVKSRIYADACDIAQTTVDLESLSRHFSRGINRFTVRLGELTEEVVLNIEM
jgi:hypothetical protein